MKTEMFYTYLSRYKPVGAFSSLEHLEEWLGRGYVGADKQSVTVTYDDNAHFEVMSVNDEDEMRSYGTFARLVDAIEASSDGHSSGGSLGSIYLVTAPLPPMVHSLEGYRLNQANPVRRLPLVVSSDLFPGTGRDLPYSVRFENIVVQPAPPQDDYNEYLRLREVFEPPLDKR